MSDPRHAPIVVGIDGSSTSEFALMWAAEEAARWAVPLIVAHAIGILPDEAMSAATVETVIRESADYGQQVVDDALALIASTYPNLPVTAVLSEGLAADMLEKESRTASMLVVGRRSAGRIAGILRGSVSNPAAAHAHCPVVVIDGQHAPAAGGPVVVGLDSSPGSHEALVFAFEEARSRGAELVAVRAWGDVRWGEWSFGFSPVIFTEWGKAERLAVVHFLSAVRPSYPDVTVRTELIEARPESALTKAAEGACLLVVGCRLSDDHRHRRLGPTASWILHHSPAPVAIIGHAPPVDPALLATAQLSSASAT
jgi:nucleotide-binding universal stress UspA family protein